ncbi:MAG TPA: hypothetical protein VEO53_14225, partial [Candidatus Binatia bacterium]|nr:hypothetical protein [Candidatus Binatia bacterium]
VELEGTLQPTTDQAPANVLAAAVATLKTNLAQGPFHVQILSEAKTSTPGVSPTLQPAAASGGNQFFVEGVMAANSPTNALAEINHE